VRLPQIAVVEKTTHHVRRDLACALLVKPVPGHELKLSIGAGQRSLETTIQKAVGLDHDNAGSPAVRMAVGQPEELRWFGLLRHVGKYRPHDKSTGNPVETRWLSLQASSSPAALFTEIIAGQVQLLFSPVASSIEYIKAGKLRALAVTTTNRLDMLADIPPITDFVPGFEATVSQGLCATVTGRRTSSASLGPRAVVSPTLGWGLSEGLSATQKAGRG
jgi:hypothetical protein